MVCTLSGSPDDVASRRKRKLNFSDLRFGCSIYVPKLVKAPSISIEPPPTAKPLGTEEAVVLRRQDQRGVGTLTLNRPHAVNALSETILAALHRQFEAIGGEDSVRVVVLAADGRAFWCGHDVKEMRP